MILTKSLSSVLTPTIPFVLLMFQEMRLFAISRVVQRGERRKKRKKKGPKKRKEGPKKMKEGARTEKKRERKGGEER